MTAITVTSSHVETLTSAPFRHLPRAPDPSTLYTATLCKKHLSSPISRDTKEHSIKRPADMATTVALREALNLGISSGNLVDIKIILYSHRDSSGRVCRPKALYANSHVLKTIPYFNDRESTTTVDSTRPKPHGITPKVLFGSFTESQSKGFGKEEIDDEEFGEDYGYLSDSDLEDDEDERVASFKNTSKPKACPYVPHGGYGKGKWIICEEYEEHAEKGKVVKIPDMAFVT